MTTAQAIVASAVIVGSIATMMLLVMRMIRNGIEEIDSHDEWNDHV